MRDDLFPIAMQRKMQTMSRPNDHESRGEKAGWRAFALGMAGMFAVMALWVALAERAEAPDAEIEMIGRPQSAVSPPADRRDSRAE
ncbi:hypothetical protein [Brevundimonas sp.]|uniref:hypothetical protein n=1 Tax=Brevundimonas sp. TaxID=1871086 RepID=UPI0037C11BAC